jgi:hypothetical protein
LIDDKTRTGPPIYIGICRPREGKRRKKLLPFVDGEQLLSLQHGSAGRYTVAVRGTEEERKSDKNKRRTRGPTRGEGVVLVRVSLIEVRVEQMYVALVSDATKLYVQAPSVGVGAEAVL